MYLGEVEDEIPHGLGVEILASGTRYEGLFTQGKKGPRGIIYFHDGNIYEGEMFESALHGNGRLIYKD